MRGAFRHGRERSAADIALGRDSRAIQQSWKGSASCDRCPRDRCPRCGLSSRAAELILVQISQTSRMLIVLSLNVKAVNAAEDARSAFLPPCDSLERGGAGHLGIRDHSFGYAEWHEDFIRQNPPETETGFISGACYTCAHSSRCAFACSLALDPGNSLL